MTLVQVFELIALDYTLTNCICVCLQCVTHISYVLCMFSVCSPGLHTYTYCSHYE